MEPTLTKPTTDAAILRLAKRSALTTQDPEMQRRARERALGLVPPPPPPKKVARRKRPAANTTAGRAEKASVARKAGGTKRKREGKASKTKKKAATANALPSGGGKPAGKARLQYYAVRAGRALPSAGSDQPFRFRSAIFLRLEDAREFSEYAAFDSFAKAEEYLRRGEYAPPDSEAIAADPSSEPVKSGGSDPDDREDSRDGYSSKPSAEDEPKNSWDKMFLKLIEYKEAHQGSVEIPEGEKGSIALGKWLTKQLRLYQHHASLTKEHVEKLEGLGVVMPPSWEDMHDRLAAHRDLTESLDLTKDDDEKLHLWVLTQKVTLVNHFQGKPTALSAERVNKLKTLGYAPSRANIIRPGGIIDGIAAEAKWEAMLEELVEYMERNGGSAVFADNDIKHLALRRWASDQRREFKLLQEGKPSSLTGRRLQRLTAVGFNPNPKFECVSWEERIASLRRFVEENGHCRPPTKHPELGVFVSEMRSNYKKRERGEKNYMTDERMNELSELGFVFQVGKTPKRPSIQKSWDERFQDLLKFKEENGHTVVPQLSGSLGGWVRTQRVEYKRYKAGKLSRMTAEKALRLTEIGFCFDASARFGGIGKGES